MVAETAVATVVAAMGAAVTEAVMVVVVTGVAVMEVAMVVVAMAAVVTALQSRRPQQQPARRL